MVSTIEKQIEDFSAGSVSEYAFPAELSVGDRKLVKSTAEKLGLSTKSFGMGGERRIHVFKSSASTTPELEAVKYSVKNTFVDAPVDPSAPQATQVGPAHQSMPVGGLQAHIAAEEREAPTELTGTLLEKLSTMLNKAEESPPNSHSGSTADSESEPAQDPTISIKNSFVHFEGDSDGSGDPRIIQSMPDGKFAENIEAEKAAARKERKQKGRPLPFSEDPEPEAEKTSAVVFPSTPNAEMSFGGATAACPEYGQAVPVVQWIPPTTAPQDSSVTVLPPACWATSAPSQSPPDVSAQACGVSQPDSSVTSLQPACWTPSMPVQTDTQGIPQVPLPLMPTLEPVPAPPPGFTPGTSVVICGLASQPTFNGLQGTVSSYDADCARYNIMVDIGPNATRRMVKVKFQNLILAQPLMPPVMPPQPPCYSYHESYVPQPSYSYAPQPAPAKAKLSLDMMI